MTVVVDASAVLAYLQGEDGSDVVEACFAEGARCGAANWSEVAQRVLAKGRDWDLVRALLISYEVGVEPVLEEDAEWAARRWRRREGLALADRLCLGLGDRLGVEVLTADSAWGSEAPIRQIR